MTSMRRLQLSDLTNQPRPSPLHPTKRFTVPKWEKSTRTTKKNKAFGLKQRPLTALFEYTAVVSADSSKSATAMNLTGQWTKYEHLTFLYGLRTHGAGKWKKIAAMLPTRNNIQIKSHGQQVLKKMNDGVSIFHELDEYFVSQEKSRQKALSRLNPMSREYSIIQFQTSRPRPPDEVLAAACSLVELASASSLKKMADPVASVANDPSFSENSSSIRVRPHQRFTCWAL